MITPEDDLDTWNTVFQTTCEPNGDYLLLLPDFSRLLSYYVDNSKLPEPIEDDTQEFSQETVLTLLRLIFNLSYVSEDELIQLKKEIKSIISYSAKGYINSVPYCNKYLEYSLTSTHNFYLKNTVPYTKLKTTFDSLFTEIFQYFLHEGPADQLIDFINNHPTIDYLSYFFSLISKPANNFQPTDTTDIISKLQNSLIAFYSQFDDTNLRNFDRNILFSITSNILRFLNLDEVLLPIRLCLLKFGDLCLRCSFVDKNLIGSSILKKLSEIDQDSFRQFSIETNFLDFIFTKDIHEKVLTELAPIVPKIFTETKPTQTQLLQLYNKAKLSVSSQKAALNLLLANLLKICNDYMIIEFLHSITDDKQLSNEFINFVNQFISTASSTNSFSCFTRFILNLLDDDTKNLSILNNAIKQLCKCTVTDSFRNSVYEYLLERIPKGPFKKEHYKSIKRLIRTVIKKDCEEQKQLIQICIDNKQLKLVKAVLMYSETKLHNSTINNLTLSNEGWEVLLRIINKRGTNVFADLDELQIIINRLDIKHATMNQFLVIKEILLAMNVQSKKITTSIKSGPIDHYFSVINPQIDSSDILYKFITRTDDKDVNKAALDFLLSLYKDAKQDFFELFAFSISKELDENESILLIKESPIDFEPYMLLDDQIYLSKLLTMVNSMIVLGEKNIDITEYGIDRHKSQHKNDFFIKVKLDNEIKQIKINKKSSISDLKAKILFIFKKEQTTFKILNEQNVAVRQLINIKPDEMLIASCEQKFVPLTNLPETCMTKIISSKNIHYLYYRLIKQNYLENELKKSVWKFLMLMPSINGITLNDLQQSKTQMETRYLIQSFLNTGQCENELIYSTVIDEICENKIELFGLGDALKLINNHFIFDKNENKLKFARFLFDSILNPNFAKIHSLILDVMISFSKSNQELLTNEILADQNKFTILIVNSSDNDKLAELFENLCEKPKIFSMLVSIFQKDHKDIFNLLKNVFDSSCDVSQFLQICVEIFKKQTEDKSKFACCSFLLEIFTKQPSLLTQNLLVNDLFELLLNSVFQIIDNNTQSTVLDLIELFCKSNENHLNEFNKMLKNHFKQINTDKWCYDPLINMKSETGYTGLRNLGATCYMNSIFQQLYFNNEFRLNLIKMRPTEQWIIELRNLFISMMFTKERIADTSKFVNSWRPFKEPTNPREQQDACEFLLLVLDKLKDELYKGEMVSVNEGETEQFKSETSEVFWNIQLDVKGCSTFEDSFNSFLQKESISEYFADTLQKKIDIVHYFRIRKLPKYLVVQLKRFEYDVNTWRKIKINDRFVFPSEFDISPLLEDSTTPPFYQLFGIVLHCGTIEGGHYTSYIKHNDKWFSLNDGNVELANERKLLEEAYGYNKLDLDLFYEFSFAERESAYLLFYIKTESLSTTKNTQNNLTETENEKDTTKTENITNQDENSSKTEQNDHLAKIENQKEQTESQINQNENSTKTVNENEINENDIKNFVDKDDFDCNLMKEIENNNSNFIQMQSSFTPAILNAVMKSNDLDLNITYFLHIFCHSHHTSLADKFSQHIINILSNNVDNYNQIIKLFIDKSENVFEIFVNCTNTSIITAVSNIIKALIINSSIENSREFISAIIEYIQKIVDNWRCLSQFFELIVLHCNRDTIWICEHNWPVLILDFIKNALNRSKSIVYLKNIDFSSYFTFIDSHINENVLDTQHLIELINLARVVLQSQKHSDQFIKIVVKCSELNLIDLNQFIENLLTDVKDYSVLLALFVQFSNNQNILEKFLESPHISKLNLASQIDKTLTFEKDTLQLKEPGSLRSKLVQNPKILFYLITCDDVKAARKMEGVYLSVFPYIDPLFCLSRAESALKNPTYFKESFTWNDSSDTFALNEDYKQMCSILNYSIDGLNEIILNTKKYFTGNHINRRFNNFIRVIYWMILRTRVQLEKSQMDIIFNFFETLNNLSIKDNTAIIEMTRLLRVLPERQMIYDSFVHLSDIIFKSEFTPILREFSFVVFMESFLHDFITKPELFECLINQISFSLLFKNVIETNREDTFDYFLIITIKNKVDLSCLIESNFDALRKNNPVLLVIVLPFAKQFLKLFRNDAETLQDLISSFVGFVSSEHCTKFIQKESIDFVFDYLHEEMTKIKCFVDSQNFDAMKLHIKEFIKLLSRPTYVKMNDLIRRMLDDLSCCNYEFKIMIQNGLIELK